MRRKLQLRFVVIVIVLSVSVFLFYPPSEKISLGLDLKGGIHLVLQVLIDEALEAEINHARELIEADLRRENISFTRTRVTKDQQIEIVGVSQDQQAAAEDSLDQYAGTWSYQPRFSNGAVDWLMRMHARSRKSLADLTVRQAKEIIQNRVDQYGVAEPTITIYGSGDVKDQIIVELPGVDDPGRVINLIKSTARLELKLVHFTQGGPYPSREASLRAFNGALPEDYEILPYRDSTETGGTTMYMVVRKGAAITGQHLKNARRTQDSFTGRFEIDFFLNPEGVRLFTTATEQNVDHRLAIVLDKEIRSAPNIREKISSDSARITGNFTLEQAEDLALTLRSGALPASIRILENRIIGPSLGMDSIQKGVTASTVGLLLVVLGMLVFYKLSGINAIFCLVLNLMILLGVMAYFRATLTLPGIAGIILTIGMAVDANILIFERIKEELRRDIPIRSAVDAGFSRVFTTIIDTNLTTLIAALFLFQFGTGPVRGFAVTLAVGLMANIFAATFVSRTIFSFFLRRRALQKLSI
jgi:preprotein translocase subunit SecD